MKKLLLCVGLLAFLGGCTSVAPINGGLYTEATAGITGSGKMGPKEGEACMKSIIGVAMGDVSVAAAAKNGEIHTISHVDNRTRNILGLYSEYCTVVHGF